MFHVYGAVYGFCIGISIPSDTATMEAGMTSSNVPQSAGSIEQSFVRCHSGAGIVGYTTPLSSL